MIDRGTVERDRANELARRINLLLDVIQTETGERYSFEHIRDELAKYGVKISSGRWFYMIKGDGPLVTDVPLLTALADFFQVDRSYLIDWELKGLPERIDSQLELVKSLRAARITSFAARTLGPLSAEGTRALAKLVEDEMNLQARDTH